MLEIPHDTREVALMKEKLEFAVFKLEHITDEYSQYVTLIEQAAAHHLYIEHKTSAYIVITKCLEYVEPNETSTEQVQKHLTTFSIIVHTAPKKVNQSRDYHHKIPLIHANPST